MNGDLRFHGFEFRVAGHDATVTLLGYSGGVRNGVAGFPVSRFKDQVPVNRDHTHTGSGSITPAD